MTNPDKSSAPSTLRERLEQLPRYKVVETFWENDRREHGLFKIEQSELGVFWKRSDVLRELEQEKL